MPHDIPMIVLASSCGRVVISPPLQIILLLQNPDLNADAHLRLLNMLFKMIGEQHL